MDGVTVDFEGHAKEMGLSGDELKHLPGAYIGMKPMPGAIEAIHSIIGMGFEVWMATKPPTGLWWAYADKAQWVFIHLPELKRRLIITHDKGLLGDINDILIDDRPHKANCSQFPGTLIFFGGGCGWPQVLAQLRERKPKKAKPHATVNAAD